MITGELVVTAITAIATGGVGAAVMGYIKDRKKDLATAKLTDVEALQKQVVLLTSITEYLRKENDQLREDYNQSEEQRRIMRQRLTELEHELETVRRSAADTQEQCSRLSEQLKQLVGEVKP